MNDIVNLSQFQVPYERKINKNCQICNHYQFSLIKKQHICKRCFRSVCQNCSAHKVKSYKPDRKHRLHRMCDICFKQSEYLQKYVKNNHLKWNQDSDLVRLWKKILFNSNQRNKSTLTSNQSRNQRFFTQQLNSTKINVSYKNYKQFVQVDQLWKSLNFSFRQFIGIVLDENNLKEQDIIQDINASLCQLQIQFANIINSNTKVKSMFRPQILVYLVIFFMLHSTMINSIQIIVQLYKLLCPYIQKCQNSKYCKQVLQNIGLYLGQAGCSDIQIYKIESFFQQQVLDDYIDCLTINKVTAEMSINIISQIISKGSQGFIQIEKGLAYIFTQRKQFICHNSSSSIINIDIIKNVDAKNYKKFLKDVQHVERIQRAFNNNNKIQNKNNNLNQNEQSQQSSVSQLSQTINKSQIDLKKYKKMIKQNQQLKIRNKNQQQQIIRLKKRLNLYQNGPNIQKLLQKQSSGRQDQIQDQQYQEYYEQQDYIDGYQQIQIEVIGQNTNKINASRISKNQFQPFPDRGTRFYDNDDQELFKNYKNNRFSYKSHLGQLNENHQQQDQYDSNYDDINHLGQLPQSTIQRVSRKIDHQLQDFQYLNQNRMSTLTNQNYNKNINQRLSMQGGLQNQSKRNIKIQKKPIIKTRLVKKRRLKNKSKNTQNKLKNNIANNNRYKNQQQRQTYLSDHDVPNKQNADQQSMLAELLQKKNEQIGKLKQQISSMKRQINQANLKYQIQLNQETQQFQQKQNQIRTAEKKINKLTQQKISLENMNKLLLIKLDQLAKLLNDKQQKQIQMINKQQKQENKIKKNQNRDSDSISSSSPTKKNKNGKNNKNNKKQQSDNLLKQKQMLKKYAQKTNLTQKQQQQIRKNIIKLYMYQQYQNAQQCKII